MTYTVIESTNKRLLKKFQASAGFRKFLTKTAKVTSGTNEGSTEDQHGRIRNLPWILIEDARNKDHATYRVLKTGLTFWSTGVEI